MLGQTREVGLDVTTPRGQESVLYFPDALRNFDSAKEVQVQSLHSRKLLIPPAWISSGARFKLKVALRTFESSCPSSQLLQCRLSLVSCHMGFVSGTLSGFRRSSRPCAVDSSAHGGTVNLFGDGRSIRQCGRAS